MICSHIRNYTTKVHVTATHDNTLLGNTLKEQLKESGLHVREATYNVLLSYPDWYIIFYTYYTI